MHEEDESTTTQGNVSEDYALEDIQSAFKFNSIKERAFRLLTSGATPQQTAFAVGCTPAYVSQLLADEEFALSVSLARSKYMQEKLEREQRMDNKKDSIEDQLLTKLEQLVPYMNKPQDIVNALRVANQLKRSAPAHTPVGEVSQSVKLSLPAHLLQKAKVQIQISPQGEIISANNQTFLSPSIQELQKPHAQQHASREPDGQQQGNELGIFHDL